jgi:hypothetical protein
MWQFEDLKMKLLVNFQINASSNFQIIISSLTRLIKPTGVHVLGQLRQIFLKLPPEFRSGSEAMKAAKI